MEKLGDLLWGNRLFRIGVPRETDHDNWIGNWGHVIHVIQVSEARSLTRRILKDNAYKRMDFIRLRPIAREIQKAPGLCFHVTDHGHATGESNCTRKWKQPVLSRSPGMTMICPVDRRVTAWSLNFCSGTETMS